MLAILCYRSLLSPSCSALVSPSPCRTFRQIICWGERLAYAESSTTRHAGDIGRFATYFQTPVPLSTKYCTIRGRGSDNIKLFPDDDYKRQPTYGLISDHIHPLSGPIPKAIVDAFCPEHLKAQKQEILAVPINKDCLVRLYLGRRGDGKRTSNGLKLRNFELLVDDMERLQLEVEAYAKIIAQTLAILHWCASVDGDDVEFILGSAPQSPRLPTLEELENAGPNGDLHASYEVDFQRRSVGIWLLDFNQCNHFEDNSEGLKMLISSFWFNDPYYPRPVSANKSDKALWKIFAKRYLEVSAEITTSQTPKSFIDGVVREGEKRAGSGFLFG